MEKWSCIWDDFANPKIGLNLLCKSKGSARTLGDILPQKTKKDIYL